MLTIGAITLYHGTIDAVRCNVGQKSAIVWRFLDREVWIDEVPAVGRKRALYEWHKRSNRLDARTTAKLAKLEGEASDTIDRLHAEALAELEAAHDGDDLYAAAMELGIDLDVEIVIDDEYTPTAEDNRLAAIAALG